MSKNKDLGCTWNFLLRQKGEMKHGKEDSSFNPFKDAEIHSLVREYIQNSLDVPVTDDAIVEVEFSFGELACDDYPNLIQSLILRIKACSDRCRSFENSKDPYKTKYEYLLQRQHGTIGYLRVSDYNTTGMDFIDDDDIPSAFDACVHNASASFKANKKTGGSHGQGKTVGFVNSAINAVYYSTMTADSSHKTFGEGVIRLCDHKFLDAEGNSRLYQADAFYNNGGLPNSGTDIPEDFRRTLPGTDAYVLGMEASDEIKLQMKQALLRSFFKAIFDEKLKVTICGEVFEKANLQEKMEAYFPEPRYGVYDVERGYQYGKVFNPKPYCYEIAMSDVIDENHITISTDDFPNEFPLLGHAVLKVWKDGNIKTQKSQDTIVFMRDKLMAIRVQRYRSSHGFYGVLVCDGVGSDNLREMENVTHDKWDESELKDMDPAERESIIKTLKELDAFCKACIKKIFPDESGKESKIDSLKRRRIAGSGDSKNQQDEDAYWPITNELKDQKSKGGSKDAKILETLSGKSKGKKKKGKKVDAVLPPDQVPVNPPGPNPPGPQPPEPVPPGPDPVDPPVPHDPKEDFPTNPPEPTVSGEGAVEGHTDEIEVGGHHMREVKLGPNSRRVIPLHDGLFAAKIIINAPRDFVGCKMVLMVQGVNGQVPLKLKRVSDGCKISGVDSNEIIGFDLTKGINQIKFTPEEVVRNYSLIIKAYGN